MMGNVYDIMLAFDKRGEIEIDEARRLVISCADILLDEVNKSEKLKPHLCTYPFPAKNISIKIFVKKEDGSFPDRGKISAASLSFGEITYRTYESTYVRNTALEETYEEAKAKLALAHTN